MKSVATSPWALPACEVLEPRLLLSVGWSPEAVGTAVGTYTSIAINPETEMPVISFYEPSSHDLKLARWDGTEWDVEAVLTANDVGKFSSLAIDSDGNPHIAYYDATNTALLYSFWDGDSWTHEVVYNTGDVGEFASLALDSTGQPSIAFYDNTNDDLLYTSRAGGVWAAPTIVAAVGEYNEAAAPYVHNAASLALEADGTPHVSFYDAATKDLMYASLDGTWSSVTVEDDGDSGADNSLVLDADGNPHIAFFHYISVGGRYKGTLDYAEFDGSWTTETAFDPGWTESAGKYNSIALDAAGNPAISFYAHQRDLRFVRRSGTSWVTAVVDNTGSTGFYSDLAFDGSGLAHVSYAKTLDGQEQLKYAGAARADLAVTVEYEGQLDVLPGDYVTIPVRVSNSGNTAMVGTGTLTIRISDDQTIGDDGPVMATKVVRLNLDPGESALFNLRFQVPLDTNPETLYLVAGLEDGAGLAEDVLSNNTSLGEHPTEVVWKFGTIDGRRVKLRVFDAQDNLVTFSLTGGGVGTVAGGGDFSQITLDGTTAKSGFKIATRRGVTTSVGDIIVNGPLKALDARTTNVTDDVLVDGFLRSLRLHDLAGGNTITLNNSDADVDPRIRAAIVLGEAGDGVDADNVTLISKKLAISSLTVDDWSDNANSITAPSIAKLTQRDLDGEMSGTMTLTGDAARYVLAKALFKGELSDATWTLTGDVGAVQVKGTQTDTVALTADSLKSLKANELSNVGITVDDAVASLAALSWDGGSLTANSLGKLALKGNRTGNAGEMSNVDVTLHGVGMEGLQVMKSFYTKGQIESVDLFIGGNAGKVDVARFNNSRLLMGATNLTDAEADFGGTEFMLKGLKIRGMDDSGMKHMDESQVGVWEIGSVSLGGTPTGMTGILEFWEIYRSNYEFSGAENPDLDYYDLNPEP